MIARITLTLILICGGLAQASGQTAPNHVAVSYPRTISSADAKAVLPATVFFKGQSAAIQARNSGGIEFAKSRFLLATLVDTSGYSTSVQERYQAYLITEMPVIIDGHRLTPGAYGCGFIAGDQFAVMDLGGNDLFVAASKRDPGLKRPTPLQITADPASVGTYRLYAGRTYVELKAAPEQRP